MTLRWETGIEQLDTVALEWWRPKDLTGRLLGPLVRVRIADPRVMTGAVWVPAGGRAAVARHDDGMADRLLTTKEAAHLLAVTTSWLSSAATRGDVPGYRVAGGWRFDVDELGLWLTLRGNAAVEMPDNPRRRILPPPRPGGALPRPEPFIDLENTVLDAVVAEALNVPVEAVRRWVLEEILPGVRSGSSWLVDAWAFEQWQAILARGSHIASLPPGRARTGSIREVIASDLLRRMGICGYSLTSWQRRGGQIPTWAEAVIDGRHHR